MNKNIKKLISGWVIAALVLTGVQPHAFALIVPVPGASGDISTTDTTQSTLATPISQLLFNRSFENAINGSNNWDATAGRGITLQTPGVAPPDGVQVLQLTPLGAASAASFTFQSSLAGSVAEGDTITFSAQVEVANYDDSGLLGTFFELVMEFKDVNNGTISSVDSANLTADQAFGLLTLGPSAAPAGTDHISFVMRIQNAASNLNTTRVRIDSASATKTVAAAALRVTDRTTVNNGSNELLNPGFESSIGGSGNWDNTANRGISIVSVGAPEGSNFLRLSESAATTGGVFTFQTVSKTVSPGDRVTFSGLVRVNNLLVGQLAQLVIEYQTKAGTTISSDVASISSTSPGFTSLVASGNAPSGAEIVTFTLRIQPSTSTGSASVDFDQLVGTINPTQLNVTMTKSKGKAGDVIPAAITFTNTSDQDFTGVEMRIKNPPGINVDLSKVLLNDANANAREGSVIIPVGTVAAGDSVGMVLQFLITAGVVPGHNYDIDFILTDSAGMNLKVRERILIEEDAMFGQSTAIGKVFHDKNRDGKQQVGEDGMPFVNLYTEEGIMVTTDENGMYHIPNLKPGRHVLKIDAHTLPENTEFITEEAYLFKSTPGVMNKVNFAVAPRGKADWEGGNPNMPKEFEGDLNVSITQGLDTTPPQLDVTMEPNVLRLGAGVLERQPIFNFDINYPHLVKKWMLEIRDEMGRKVWSGYGIGKPPADVMWQGLADSGVLISPGIYAYQFKVEDDKGRQDWSLLKFFRVFSKAGKVTKGEDWEGAEKEEMVYQSNPKANKNYREEISPIGNFNIFKDGKRSIPLVAKPTVHVRGQTHPGFKAYVNDAPVEVNEDTGRFDKEFYVKPGDNEFVVNVVSPEGESTLYTQKVKVKDSMFFLVGLGEQELGKNFAKGNINTAGADDQYKDGFYQDGRLSYFLKGKLKGKFLVKSKFDTGDNRSALFTNLDPDQYYPIYGDKSQINYEGQNTNSRFYMLVEMDRSFARWGSFQTQFDDTELASYNRTLSGLQVHHESLQTTPYGDPKRGFKVFWSESRNRPRHVELESTGGTLYYLRDSNIVQGSEQLHVEVRDKIQDMAVARYDLKEGVDYEIDYDTGRVMLSRPLSSLAPSSTNFSTDLADGDRIFLTADYEYVEGFDPLATGNRGGRGFVNLGDHVRVGGTLVEEKRDLVDYDMRGVDMTMKFGRNTKVVSEYATTMLSQGGQAVSYDGGINYADLSPLSSRKSDGRERAYSIKGETKPVKNLEVSGFVQGVDPGFSNDILKSQEGYKKYGVSSRYKLTDSLHAKYRYDHNEVVSSLLPLASSGLLAPYENMNAHTTGLTFDNGTWLAEAEYLHRTLDGPDTVGNLLPSLESEIPFNDGIVTKLGYQVNEKLMPYAKAQTSIHTKGNTQIGGGLRYEVTRDLYAYLEQMFGKIGDSTLFGIEKHHSSNASTYANLKSLDRGIGYKTLSTTIGSNYFTDSGSRLYSERQLTTYNSLDGFANIFGYEGKVNDHWDYGTRYERRHLNNSTTRRLDILAGDALARTNTYNTVGAHVAYAGSAQKKEDWEGNVRYSPFDRVKARVSGEFRGDEDRPELWQIVTRDSFEYKVTRDLNFLSYLNLGLTGGKLTQEGFPLRTDFMEFNTGFAYRPVNYDRFNMLTRYTRIINSNRINFFGDELNSEESSHIIQLDASYDVNRYLELVQKIGFKRTVAALLSDDVGLNSMLWANRFNFHVTRKWDVATEYRILFQKDTADNQKHGALIEVDREIYEYVRVGAGYDFANFTDDLRKANNYSSHGPFVRMTGKF